MMEKQTAKNISEERWQYQRAFKEKGNERI